MDPVTLSKISRQGTPHTATTPIYFHKTKLLEAKCPARSHGGCSKGSWT